MSKRLFSWLKRYILAIWLILSALSFTGIIVYAAYTSSHTTKSVIASKRSSGVPFSSNYLESGDTRMKRISKSENTENPSVSVTVCNYPQSDPAKFYNEDINYTITATLVDEENNKYTEATFPNKEDNENEYEEENINDYYIVYNYNGEKVEVHFGGDEAEDKFTILLPATFRLKAYEQAMDIYELHYPKSQIKNKNVFIRLEATPNNNKDGIVSISRYIGITPGSAIEVSGWTGEFTDNASVAPASYDGFNYTISGSGTEKIKLEWNTDYVNIGVWSKEEIMAEDENAVVTNSSITFSVDSSQKNIYNIQFYRTCEAEPRTNESDTKYEKWDTDPKTNKQICVLVDGEKTTNFVTFSIVKD